MSVRARNDRVAQSKHVISNDEFFVVYLLCHRHATASKQNNSENPYTRTTMIEFKRFVYNT